MAVLLIETAEILAGTTVNPSKYHARPESIGPGSGIHADEPPDRAEIDEGPRISVSFSDRAHAAARESNRKNNAAPAGFRFIYGRAAADASAAFKG